MASKETTAQPNTDFKNNPTSIVRSMNKANKSQTSQALIIQTYSNSVLQQPPVDFKDDPSLKSLQARINDGLEMAQLHVNHYTDVILPAIIGNISNIGSYYALHNSVASTLPEGSTEEEWITALNTLKTESVKYQKKTVSTVTMINTLHDNLVSDVNTFSTTVKDLNSAVDGDNGVLDSINDQLSSLQSDISVAIAGVVLSTLSILGGVFMIVVGSVSNFITAGTTIPLIVGGIGMVAGGISGETAASIKLAGFNSAKSDLLSKECKLKEEVKLATGMLSGFTSLRDKARDAVTASKEMEHAWQSLSDDLGTIISDLTNGIISTGQIRKVLLADANEDVQTLLVGIDIIKEQMAGVHNIVAKKGETVSEAILATAKGK